MKSKAKILILLGTAALVVLGVIYYPRLTLISGFAAKNMCSCVFEADRDPERVMEQDNNFSPVSWADYSFDREQGRVKASVLGFQPRIAIYREGIGCVLLPPDMEKGNKSFAIPKRSFERSKDPNGYGGLQKEDSLFPEINYARLESAVDRAFAPKNQTRAVLVLYKDHLVAERYREGFFPESKFLGWSMSKSITSAVLGILEKKGELDLEQDHLFPEWNADARSRITLNDLIQMSSGLQWKEDYSKISDVTRMLFLAEDMSEVQLHQPLVEQPGTVWNYSSGTTNLLGRFIREKFDTQQECLDFWYAELVDRIGMHSMTLETDPSGKYVGSSYTWATARDWAKFGLLYLNGGHWDGSQLFNTSWLEYTVTPVKGSGGQYGAHFWLNAGGTYPHVPRDLFSAQGFQGQYILIIPSKELVVVRFGLKEHPDFDVDRFLEEIIDAFSG